MFAAWTSKLRCAILVHDFKRRRSERSLHNCIDQASLAPTPTILYWMQNSLVYCTTVYHSVPASFTSHTLD